MAKSVGERVAKYHTTPKGRLAHLMCNMRQRCKASGVELNIDRDYLLELYEQQGGVCAVTGKPFDLRSRLGGRDYASPWGMSIDRINPQEGYIEGNVRIICTMANVAKGRWTDEELYEFCLSVVENKNG